MGTLLFAAICDPSIEAMEVLASKAKPFIDGIELRLDCCETIDKQVLNSLILNCGLAVMLTVRRKDQGGSYRGSEKERLSFIESLCELAPAYIDLEYDVPADYKKRLFESFPHIRFVSSYHDFSHTPEDLQELYRKVKTPYAHVFKLVTMATSSLDALKMLSFVQSHSERDKIIGIAMGEEGIATRILAPVVGSFLAYATLPSHQPTAPGQLTAMELLETYRFGKLNRNTQIYCLIGNPVSKSLGAIIHNAVFDVADLNAVYVKMRVDKKDLAGFFSLSSALPFKGFSVTMPHKESVIPLLSEVSTQVQAIGACNTIKMSRHEKKGYNTDGVGALDAIERKMSVSGKHVVFVGAGGAAKALIFEAVQRNAHVTVLNRTAEKAIELASVFGGRGGGLELFPEVCRQGYDVIINCIPESELIEEQWILPGTIAMDIVYVPKDTPFLVKALRKGCKIVFGYEMFARQAVEQDRIWFEEGIDLEKAYAVIEKKVTEVLL